MNKTVTINLASILFHIDEDAYNHLKNYLDAIKRSLANEDGKEEIIADIEARIAEIFNEKKQFNDQVISQSEVDHVIEIMGQPEDYAVDEEPGLENEESQTNNLTQAKKLFRDPLDKHVGGVSSGLGHYFGIDPIWVRIIWALLVLGSSGVFIFVYIGFWFFVPEALTTADQLAMKGQPVTISTIEKKIKNEINNTDLKNKTATVIERILEILKTFLKIGLKIFGVFIVFVTGATLLGLASGLIGISMFNLAPHWSQNLDAYIIGLPLWLAYLLAFIIFGIPTFFALLLGLKLLVKNLKPIGRLTSLSLIGIWILSLLILVFFGIKQYTGRSFKGTVNSNETLSISSQDTLKVFINQDHIQASENSPSFSGDFISDNGDFDFSYSDKSIMIYENDNNEKMLLFNDIKLFVRETANDQAVLKLTKKAKGSSNEKAKQRAGAINFKYSIKDNSIYIDPYAITEYAQKYAKQKIELTLFIPKDITLFIDSSASDIISSRSENGYLSARGKEGHYLKLKDSKLICTTCPPMEDWEDESWESGDEESKGINMNFDDDGDKFKLKIDESGINIEAKDRNGRKEEHFKLKIDEDGIKVNNI